MGKTYESPLWPCDICGGIERFWEDRKCVTCGVVRGKKPAKPPAEFHNDAVKALEAEAYEAAEKQGSSRGEYRVYGHIGGAISEKNYRPVQLGEWPNWCPLRTDTEYFVEGS